MDKRTDAIHGATFDEAVGTSMKWILAIVVALILIVGVVFLALGGLVAVTTLFVAGTAAIENQQQTATESVEANRPKDEYFGFSSSDALFEALNDRKLDLAQRRNDGTSIASWLAGKGHVSWMSELAKKPEWLDNIDGNGETPLCYAARYDRLENVKALLDAGADPNQGLKSPLSEALANENTDIVALLKSASARLFSGESAGFSPEAVQLANE